MRKMMAVVCMLGMTVIFGKIGAISEVEFTLDEPGDCHIFFDVSHYYSFDLSARNWQAFNDGTILSLGEFLCISDVLIRRRTETTPQ